MWSCEPCERSNMVRLPFSTVLRILPALVLVFLLYCVYRYSTPIAILSKSGKVCGVCFSVSQHLRKKCVNLNDNILRQRCVNHQISKNFVSKGHFCWGYTLFKCLNLRFKQWLNIIWGILQFYLWKQWNLDSFCVLTTVTTDTTVTHFKNCLLYTSDAADE